MEIVVLDGIFCLVLNSVLLRFWGLSNACCTKHKKVIERGSAYIVGASQWCRDALVAVLVALEFRLTGLCLEMQFKIKVKKQQRTPHV